MRPLRSSVRAAHHALELPPALLIFLASEPEEIQGIDQATAQRFSFAILLLCCFAAPSRTDAAPFREFYVAPGLEMFLRMAQTRRPPIDYADLLRPIQFLEAVADACR